MDNYEILGVSYAADQRTIKRAYATLIKQYRPDTHPTEFARIRLAYEVLLEQCQYRQQDEDLFDEFSFSDTLAELQSEQINNDVDNLCEALVIERVNAEIESAVEPSGCEDDERFNHLVAIQLADMSENIESNSHDSFNRLVVDKPVIATLEQADEIEANLDSWIQTPAINVNALLEQLNNYALPDHEQAALACFLAQLALVPSMNIDQRMDYEEKLYTRLIYADRPALLVFAAASAYFAWANDIAWIKAAQSKWTKQRFDALTQLSSLYYSVGQRYNPYFQVKHDAKVKSYPLTTHYHHKAAQEQRENWFINCQSANLTDIYNYFSEQPQREPIYIIDVLLGCAASYFIALLSYSELTEQQQSLWFWLMPILVLFGGGFSAVLLMGWRKLNLNISIGKKLTIGFLSVALSTRLPDDVGVWIPIGLFFSAVLVFLYCYLEVAERFVAIFVDQLLQFKLVRKIQAIHSNPQSLSPITMNKQIYPLLIAQFLSAFADNAILFTVIAMVMQSGAQPNWYIPALQSVFLIAYVVLGPWVGGFADHHAKSHVLIIANIIKAVGAGLLFFNVEPLIAYCIVGVGAAIYSPAKYGILPELAGHDVLLRANSWIEGSTILAILLGMKIGAMLADYSVHTALLVTIVLFVISALATLSLPVKVTKKTSTDNALVEFGKQMALFFTTPRSRFAVLGGSLFWAAAASLRVILIVWAPLVLLSKNASQIADLTLYLTVGIIAGSIVVPYLIPLEHLRRARIPAYLMALLIIGLSLTTSVMPAQAVLFAIGMMGGMFIVPINAVLQEQGQKTIGSGSAVALQNFFQNLAMLIAVGAYTLAAAQQIDPVMAMLALGILVFVATFLVSLHLPDNHQGE